MVSAARNSLTAHRYVGSVRGASAFSYDAVITKNKRRPPTGIERSEDQELLPDARRKMVSASRESQRNFAIAAWMIRRHLDYVTSFSFQAKTGDPALDTQLEKLVEDWGKPENCDIAGRHCLDQIIRMAEARRIVDHDVFLVKLADGRIQAVEGDRVRTPVGDVDNSFMPVMQGDQIVQQWVQGIQIDRAGKALKFAICRRGTFPSAFILDRIVPAQNCLQHATFERFDQIRGISPISAALNTMRDIYEGFDLALAKMKVAQLFGLAIYRSASDPLDDLTPPSATTDSGDDDNEDIDNSGGYKVDFNAGPALLDLDPGDRAEFLESKSPSIESQTFFQTMITVALKCLDIPYSFYAENFTNYSGSRGAYLQYEQAAKVKRKSIRALLDALTRWRILLWIQDGQLPASAQDAIGWEWIHSGMPWLDPSKEIDAELRAIDAGLDNFEDVAQRHGRNFFANVDKNKACREYADQHGQTLITTSTAPAIVAPAAPGQPAPQAEKAGNNSGDQPGDNPDSPPANGQEE